MTVFHFDRARLACRPALLLLLLVFLAPTALAGAESWSIDGSGEGLAPSDPKNRIIKWCEDGGTKVRYASANLKIKGYTPCGRLAASATCDATGNRIIGKTDDRPRDHRDCSVGPRIVIINHDPGEIFDTSSAVKDGEEVEEMSAREQQDLKRDFEEAQEKQQEDPVMALQQVVDSVVAALMSSQTVKVKHKARNRRATEKQLEKMLKNVDPQTRKMLKDMLNP